MNSPPSHLQAHPQDDNLLQLYRQRSQKYAEEITTITQIHFRYSLLRLALFVMGICVSIWTWPLGSLVFLLSTAFWLVGFSSCIWYQSKLDKKRAFLQALHDINHNELILLEGGANVYYNGADYNVPHHPYASDLDVFGPFSLYRLLNRSRTYRGQELLAGWLSKESLITEIYARQALVQKLTADIEFRQHLAAHLWEFEDQHLHDPILVIERGLQGDFSFAARRPLLYYRQSLPAIWISLCLLYYFAPDLAYIGALIIGLSNFILTMFYASKVSVIQSKLSGSVLKMNHYAKALSSILKRDWDSTYLPEGLLPLTDNKEMPTSVQAMRALQSIMDRMDYRLHLIPATILNIGLLWDIKIVYELDKWKRHSGAGLRNIFETIGHVEALNALATWAFNHPTFNYPLITDEYFTMQGRQLIHPLMSPSVAVANDFDMLKGDYVNIVTGSNMSGKSTFLRTIGTNMVLAQTGTTIAGASLTYSHVQLLTYMRVKDALEENASTFKAELDRVDMILKVIDSQRPCLVLIDEMLRGTNSKDKLRGSIAFAKKVINSQAYAIIATHDIQLAEMAPIYPQALKNYYFDIDYIKGELVFDYKIKKGICENFNASYLLQKMGLEL